MFDTHKPHPLLAQVPLTVSPFISIPTAVTLPYTFRSVPSSLPPSIVQTGTDKPQYITSSSGHAAHPEDIVKSCTNLRDHITKTQRDAQNEIEKWENSIKERDLAEKRRVAPGWLDRDEKLLQPTVVSKKGQDLLGEQELSGIQAPAISPSREGEELDRAFGGLNMK